jgi:hypothetical protein
MSFFKKIFSSKKDEEKAAQAAAAKADQMLPESILKHKDAISVLEKRQQLLEKKIADAMEEAKTKAANNDKRGALIVLKRKKMLEQELETLMNSHMTLEQHILTLEGTQASQLAIQALQSGVAAQKAMNQQMKIEKIDDLMEDLQEQQELQNEVAQVLSQGTRVTDDADLLAELEALQADDLAQKLPSTTAPSVKTSVPPAAAAASSSPVLPAVPTLSAEEERELAELQALRN